MNCQKLIMVLINFNTSNVINQQNFVKTLAFFYFNTSNVINQLLFVPKVQIRQKNFNTSNVINQRFKRAMNER